HNVQAAQEFQSIGCAEPICADRWSAVAVAALIECKYYVTAPCELDCEPVLRFPGIEVPVNCQNGRRRCFGRRVRRNVEEGTHPNCAGSCKANIQDADAAARLDEVC